MLLTEYTIWKHADQPKPAINHNSQQLQSQTTLHGRAQTNLNSLHERMNLWSWAKQFEIYFLKAMLQEVIWIHKWIYKTYQP